MTLYDIAASTKVTNINSLIGAAGSIEFYTSGGYPTTGLMGTTALNLSNPAMNGTTSDATNYTGTFAAIATATMAAAGTQTVSIFALWNTNDAASRTAARTGTNVVLTGSVGTNAGDITFNTNVWSEGDNIQISSLTFVQPK